MLRRNPAGSRGRIFPCSGTAVQLGVDERPDVHAIEPITLLLSLAVFFDVDQLDARMTAPLRSTDVARKGTPDISTTNAAARPEVDTSNRSHVRSASGSQP